MFDGVSASAVGVGRSLSSGSHQATGIEFISDAENREANETTSTQSESSYNTLQPKIRPFDIICMSSKSKLKKSTNETNHLQTGKMLKYLDSLMENLSAWKGDQLVKSHLHQSQILESCSFTAVDTLTYSEVARHLTTLRTEHVQRFIRPMLQRLLLHPRNIGNLFNKPVDPIVLELPDYFTRIKRPMDLGTVKSRLQRGFYRNIDSVTADINLVFKNAILYNASNHAIHLIAKTMKADFETDLTALEEKCTREMDRKATHTCTLCQGESCPLCGEKCLKFDPPVLVCHGTCLQRVKRNSVYYVTVDGIMLWCQRCYTGLPPVVLELPNRPPLLKKNLLKRRLDEEVAEPWVSCDICGHWFHHICALYNDRISVSGGGRAITGGTSTSTSLRGPYECPLCKLEAAQESCKTQEQGQTNGQRALMNGERGDNLKSSVPDLHVSAEGGSGVSRNCVCVCDLYESTSDSEMGEGEVPAVTTVSKIPVPPLPLRTETRSRAGVVATALERAGTGTGSSTALPTVPSRTRSTSVAVIKQEKAKIVKSKVIGGLSKKGLPVTLTAYNAVEEEKVVNLPRDTAVDCDVTVDTAVTSLLQAGVPSEKGREDCMDVSEDGSIMTHTVSLTDKQQQPYCIIQGESCYETESGIDIGLESNTGSGRKRVRDPSMSPRAAEEAGSKGAVPTPLPPHLNQWRASTLPRSHISDFLEAMVTERLRACGYEDASDSVTVRLTSNVELYMELPVTITDNLRSPEGNCLAPYIPYKQKCILLFQKVDGVDICLFCLYVHEFDERCPPPNTSVVYIAYLDSVDFFRPMEARTLVYQEILVGYFKWAQMRGFKHGHIWSCPPQRGDNFIFWCHPPHQRTPSRDRLNAWYNSILLRSSKLGVLEEVGTLWSAYFSGYGRRESSGRKDKDKDKDESRAGAGAGAGTVSTTLPTVNSDVCMDDQMSVTSKCTIETGPSVLPIPSGSSSSSGRHCKADSTTAGGEPEDAPVCPPVFEGDFWVTECLRVHRLVMGRSKGCDGQDRGVNQRKCRDLLKDLMSKPSSIPFSRPVDIVKLNIPDYPTIITNPMNLGTIRDLLRTRYYKSILHFAEAVRLTFRNALRYNPVGHSIHETARMLSTEFEASLVELLSGYIGAVPKAENVDKYLDSYPIADPLPPPAPDDAALGPGQGPGPGPGRVLPLTPATAVPPTLPRARGRRKPSPLCEVIEDTANDSSMALTPVEGQAHFDTSTMDSIDGELPPLQRADSMDSMASRGSLLSTNTTPDVHDNWAPRLLFTSTVVPSTVPATENAGGPSGHPKAFEKPTLGFKGAMALMSEIAKSVFRLKDDLFVIKFADPTGAQRSALCKKSAANKGVNEGKIRVESVVPIAVASPLLPPEKDTDQEFYSAREFQSAGHKLKPKGVCFSEPVCGAGDGTHEIESEISTDIIATDSVKQEDDDHCSFLFPRPGRATLMATKYTSDMKTELHLGENGRDGKDIKHEGMRRTERDQIASNMDLSGAHAEEASMIAGNGSMLGAQTDHSLTASLVVNGTVPVIVASYDVTGMTAEGLPSHHLQVKNPPPLSVPLSAAPETTRHPRSPSRKRSNHKKSKSHHAGPKQKLAAAAAVVPISILDPDTASHEPLIAGPGGHANGAPDRLKKAKASTYLKQLSGEVDEAFEEKFSDRCLKLLAHLEPDTSDPDPIIKCAFVDNRHTFLEMCQFRHYQFDTLRRAKHSSLMLLYHLHFPDSANARPTCACCEGAIRDVRWHCDQCADFDICEQCYRAGEEVEAENAADLASKHKGKEVASSSNGVTPVPSSQPLKVEKHCHPLTPFRITYV